ncbi:condensation domain-containing protein [Echinicola jeungdonensis]|uniref:condensation domain-containing protein n=1 Tax=Echinicola jeungdonensis TaxID=709343 RepID=UPI00338FED99
MFLHRYSGQEDIIIGTPVANRSYPEQELLIGVFINTLSLGPIFQEIQFPEFIKQVKKVALGAFAHQDLPFEKLVEELKPKRDLNRTPLFQVVSIFKIHPSQNWKCRS